MKRLIVALTVLSFLLIVSTVALFKLKNISNELYDKLTVIEALLDKDDLSSAAALSLEAYDYFMKETDIMIYFLEHDHLEELEETLSRLSPLLLDGDKSEFSAEVAKAKSLTEKLYEHELPILKNIL